jgi:hypothetical protein
MTRRKCTVAKEVGRERAAERRAARRLVRPSDCDVGDTIRTETGDCYEVVGINSTGRVALIQQLVAGRPDGVPFPRAMDERGVKISEGEFARRVPAEVA